MFEQLQGKCNAVDRFYEFTNLMQNIELHETCTINHY